MTVPDCQDILVINYQEGLRSILRNCLPCYRQIADAYLASLETSLGTFDKLQGLSDFGLKWSHQKTLFRQVVLDISDAVFTTMELVLN